jgi:phosphoglycolate phosphatase
VRSAVLFDIDGTLLRTSGASTRALSHALITTLGVSPAAADAAIAGIDFRGATDGKLMPQLGAALQVEIGRFQPALLTTYLSALEQNLARAAVEVLPGVDALLQNLLCRDDVTVGILTGNFRQAARLKLQAIGHAALADHAGGFGEDGVARAELAMVARSRLHAAGLATSARIIVVGDTEHDVSCGKHIGAVTVAVATGWTERSSLEAAQPDLLLEDLAAPEALLALLEH